MNGLQAGMVFGDRPVHHPLRVRVPAELGCPHGDELCKRVFSATLGFEWSVGSVCLDWDIWGPNGIDQIHQNSILFQVVALQNETFFFDLFREMKRGLPPFSLLS